MHMLKQSYTTSFTHTIRKNTVPLDEVNTNSESLEPVDGANQVEPPSIPAATYTSIQLDGEGIHIAEASGGSINTHKRALLNNDAAIAVLNWLKEASQRRQLQIVAACLPEDDQLKELISRLWLQEDIVPYTIRRDTAHLP